MCACILPSGWYLWSVWWACYVRHVWQRGIHVVLIVFGVYWIYRIYSAAWHGVSVCMNAHIHANMQAYKRTNIEAYKQTDKQVQDHTYLRMHIRTDIQTYMCTYMASKSICGICNQRDMYIKPFLVYHVYWLDIWPAGMVRYGTAWSFL